MLVLLLKCLSFRFGLGFFVSLGLNFQYIYLSLSPSQLIICVPSLV